MGISYEDVLSYHGTMKDGCNEILAILDKAILQERDTNRLPVYSTKRRVKHPDSIYLKTKRKSSQSLKDINDLAGLRVLCLFESDIPKTHGALLKIFTIKKGTIKEMRAYNWKRSDDGNIVDLIEGYTKAAGLHIDMNPTLKKKESGYKSIHYIVKIPHFGKKYFVEVQLRTLLQDAWGELEHNLSYKQGNIHPHIKKSFQLLARDLQTNDYLIGHLRDISKKDKIGELHSIHKAGPEKWMGYEEELLPTAFTRSPQKEQYEAYKAHVSNVEPAEQPKEWLTKAKKLLENLTSDLPRGKAREKERTKYFCDMEEAWLKFSGRKYPEALNCYQKLLPDYKHHYIIHFRIGELYFILEETAKALASFDESEMLLKNEGDLNSINRWHIKVKVANIYWMLGAEYSEISLAEIKEAQKILNKSPSLYDREMRSRILNNVCWYQLDQYLKSKKKRDYTLVKKEFENLSKILDEKDISSNTFDTAAWCCYNFYLKERTPDLLDLASKYCDMMDEKLNRATFMFASYNLHISHRKEIMEAKTLLNLK